MTITVENIFKKLDRIREIIKRVEDGVPIESYEDDIAELLDEYATILRNCKVTI